MADFFSPDYFAARDRFRSGVLANGGQIESIGLNATGPDGEELSIDIGWFGPPGRPAERPRRAFIHSSGVQGVDGFAGSAIQLQWLEQGIAGVPDDGAIAIVHALNPYGMAFFRRANEDNVDLNHNFLAADEEYSGAPDYYAALDEWLNPASPPSPEFFRLRLWGKSLRYGKPALSGAIAEGQYEFPLGLSFGGKQHAQATRRFQIYISGRLAWADRLVAIDVQTGPGEFGEDMLLVDGAEDCRDRDAEMQQTYGERVRALDPRRMRGTLGSLYNRMFPGANVCFAVQEFGACTLVRALAALRAENRHHHFGDGSLAVPAKAELLDTFCPPDEVWRESVLTRGKEVIEQGLALAFAPDSA